MNFLLDIPENSNNGIKMENRFYVYLLLDPRKFFLPFYVGKGCGKRAYMHLQSEKRIVSPFKTRTIEAIRSAGLEPKIMIWKDGLTNDEAKALEADLIIRFGRRGTDENGILTNSKVNVPGGNGMSLETRAKLSAANTGKTRRHSEETKERMRQAARRRSPEAVAEQTKRLVASSERRKGMKMTEEQKAAIYQPSQSAESNQKRRDALKGRQTSSGMLGRQHTEETKEKMRNPRPSMQGRTHSEETKMKMRESHRRRRLALLGEK